MAPLNSTKDFTSALIRHFHNTTIADHAAIDAQYTFVPSLTPTQTKRVVGIITGGIVLGIILTMLMCRCVEAGGRDPDGDPPPNRGHAYGHDNASSIVLAAVRPVSSYERPRVVEIEHRAWHDRMPGGSTVTRPAPVVSRNPVAWDDPPPPPYPQPPRYKS